MRTRVLGRTGLEVSVIGLGAGPVPALMTGDDPAAQRAVLGRALALGVNWIDTAAGYGEGQSESSIGGALRDLGAASRAHVATKVRLTVEDLAAPEAAVLRSLGASLARLGLPAVTLLQLHNGVTRRRGEIAAALTPADVLGPALAGLERARSAGLTRFIGLTGTGSPDALSEVIDSGRFDIVQIPHHLLAPADPEVLRRCESHRMGVFAIRAFAGGALLGHPPSGHTLKTPYFPLALYEQDRNRAESLARRFGAERSMKELAVRFALTAAVPQVALIGLSSPEQVGEVVGYAERGPLEPEWLARIAAR